MTSSAVIGYFQKNKKMPWKTYWLRASLFTSILLIAGILFFHRFTFEFDSQGITSIVNTRLYLIDKHDKEIVPGKLYSYKSPDLSPFYAEGTNFVKFLVAVPGDKVTIDTNSVLWINDKQTEFSGLPYAKSKLNVEEKNFQGTKVLEADQYWMMGDSPYSFDSRYWGTISKSRLTGRAYAVF